jgi:hypothetical protein
MFAYGQFSLGQSRAPLESYDAGSAPRLDFRDPHLNSPAPNAGTLAIEGMTHVPMTVLDGHLQRRFPSRYVQLGRSLPIDQWRQVRRLTSPYIRRRRWQGLMPFCLPQNTLTVPY